MHTHMRMRVYVRIYNYTYTLMIVTLRAFRYSGLSELGQVVGHEGLLLDDVV